MVCSDLRGQFVIEACRRAGIVVPEQIAVIGADNDEPICELCNPPLSSVIPNHEQVGYRGAALLAGLMKGEKVASATVLVPPRGVSLRQSTDVLAMEDHGVAAAVRFIREQACEGIGVDDVVAHVRMSRSVLQRKFRQELDRSIYDEIMQVRLGYAQRLLAESDLSIGMVAVKSGFGSQEYMTDVFRRKLGQPPAKYRRAHRPY
jgi:LacI family transcriptional regulator